MWGIEREGEREGVERYEMRGNRMPVKIGELAQLARALALQARGQGFESLILHGCVVPLGVATGCIEVL